MLGQLIARLWGVKESWDATIEMAHSKGISLERVQELFRIAQDRADSPKEAAELFRKYVEIEVVFK